MMVLVARRSAAQNAAANINISCIIGSGIKSAMQTVTIWMLAGIESKSQDRPQSCLLRLRKRGDIATQNGRQRTRVALPLVFELGTLSWWQLGRDFSTLDCNGVAPTQ
ncbi:hypothetical protein GNZ13_14870 [Paraburkholderia sp. 5N]|uniref:Uncharacterized protein n=1 Tax=Paraburkholderia elongata TaxID=2675747 RepID=A0A972NLM8_9BURK|nr:hypothetical protein [Paraburkholderia elongata]